MTWLEINLLALALAVDCFVVGTALGVKHHNGRQIFRLSFHFGLFQALLFVAGMYLGNLFLQQIKSWDHWVAMLILSVLGIKMIWGAIKGEDPDLSQDLSRGMYLIGFAVAVSIDAFAAGFGVSNQPFPITITVLLVGIYSLVLTILGISISKQVSAKLGTYSEIGAGLVLIGLGVKIFLGDVLAG